MSSRIRTLSACIVFVCVLGLLPAFTPTTEAANVRVRVSGRSTLAQIRAKRLARVRLRRSQMRTPRVHARRERAPAASSATTPADSVLAAVLTLVNEERQKEGLAPYVHNELLTSSAQTYAEKMREEEFFSHVSPDGERLRDRVNASGYCTDSSSCAYAENIARGQSTAQEVVRDWMRSPSHRAAILSTRYKDFGVGKDGDYWVQHFGMRSI